MNTPETTDTASSIDAIPVETKPEKLGRPLTISLIGPELIVFAIYVEARTSTLGCSDKVVTEKVFHYYVADVLVDRQVYMDCMETADRDRYCHGCMGEPEEATEPHDCELS